MFALEPAEVEEEEEQLVVVAVVVVRPSEPREPPMLGRACNWCCTLGVGLLWLSVVVVLAGPPWAWQAAAAATAEMELSSEEVDEEVDMIEEEVEPVSLVVSAPTSERTEARLVRQFKSGI